MALTSWWANCVVAPTFTIYNGQSSVLALLLLLFRSVCVFFKWIFRLKRRINTLKQTNCLAWSKSALETTCFIVFDLCMTIFFLILLLLSLNVNFFLSFFFCLKWILPLFYVCVFYSNAIDFRPFEHVLMTQNLRNNCLKKSNNAWGD